MISTSNAGRSLPGVLVSFSAAVLVLSSLAATPGHEKEPADNVGPNGSDSIFVADHEPPRGAVLLVDLRRVAVVPPKARQSMIAERTYRPAVGVMAPRGTVRGSSAWWNSPLVRVDAAKITTMFISSELRGAIQAGYIPPSDSDGTRTPWLIFIFPGMGGDWATGEFVLESTSEAENFVLREVVAIDLEQIYFRAASIDAENGLAGAEEFFMVADYLLFAP